MDEDDDDDDARGNESLRKEEQNMDCKLERERANWSLIVTGARTMNKRRDREGRSWSLKKGGGKEMEQERGISYFDREETKIGD